VSLDDASAGAAAPDPAAPDLATLQRRMAASILGVHPARSGAAAPILGGAVSAHSRLAIHRNNTMVSLTTTLERAYPALARHLGAERFKALARRFIETNPPGVPQLSAYGAGFAEHLEAVGPADLPAWAPDLARLERACHTALFAAEAAPLSLETLQALPEARYGEIVFTVHPSLRLVASPWPIEALWRAEEAPEPAPAAADTASTALVLRAAHRVTVETLEPAAAAFLAAVRAGAPLAGGAEAAAAAAPAVDLQRLLFTHLTRGSFAEARLPDAREPEMPR